MQVFKTYFKIIKKNFISIIIYFVVFAAVSVMITASIQSQTNAAFSATKKRIAIFNEENQDSSIINGLMQYLSENAQIVNLADGAESIQDALFYNNVDYVLRIPNGFTDSLTSGNNSVQLERTTTASSAAGMSIDLLINKCLNLTRFYLKNMPGISVSDAVSHVSKDLSVISDVSFQANTEQATTVNISYYFQFAAYPLLAILIMGITTIMLVFNEPNITRRNMCTPLSPFRMNLQIFLGNAAFAFTVWIAICILNFILYGHVTFGYGVILLCINALVFTVVCLAIGFLAGKYIRSGVAQSAFANVIALGISFISGIFVPQELLSEPVLKIASFTPGLWYVKAVNGIRDINTFTFQNMIPVINDMLIQLAFAAACILVALVATKQKRQNMEVEKA